MPVSKLAGLVRIGVTSPPSPGAQRRHFRCTILSTAGRIDPMSPGAKDPVPYHRGLKRFFEIRAITIKPKPPEDPGWSARVADVKTRPASSTADPVDLHDREISTRSCLRSTLG